MNKEKAINLVKEFLSDRLCNEEWYKEIDDHIKAILLYGSVAKGTNRPDSDVDVLIILPLVFEEKYTIGVYSYLFRGQAINIVLRSIERLRKLTHTQRDDFQAEVFRDSEIIWQRDNEAIELIGKIVVKGLKQ